MKHEANKQTNKQTNAGADTWHGESGGCSRSHRAVLRGDQAGGRATPMKTSLGPIHPRTRMPRHQLLLLQEGLPRQTPRSCLSSLGWRAMVLQWPTCGFIKTAHFRSRNSLQGAHSLDQTLSFGRPQPHPRGRFATMSETRKWETNTHPQMFRVETEGPKHIRSQL